MWLQTLTQLTELAHAASEFLRGPLLRADWQDIHAFWITTVFDDRFLVVYAIPLIVPLMLLRGRVLRDAIIATGLTFLGYLYGAFYAAFWLGLCVLLHALARSFARECRRTDVLPWGPPLAAWLILGGGYFASFYLARISLPAGLNDWLHANLPWLFPLGLRGLGFEPDWARLVPLHARTARGAPQLFAAVFWNPHNIGTAYLAMKMLHYFSEVRKGTIDPAAVSLRRFLAWLCYAPTIMQGPIERFGDFEQQIDTAHRRRGPRAIAIGLYRIGWGILKALVATLYFYPIARDQSSVYFEHPEQIQSTTFLYFGIYLYIFWLYLEFSGYCDIAIGVSRMIGYQVVENFRRPYLATSLRDFWRRWHISLSFLVRDYIYIALGGNRRRVLRNVILTFVVIGIWHAPMAQLAAWGVLMGIMVRINHHFSKWVQRLDETPASLFGRLRRLLRRLHPLPTILSWAVTMHFFVHSLLLFFGGHAIWKVTWELMKRMLHDE